MVIIIVETWLVCAASFVHLITLGSKPRVVTVYGHVHILFIEWRRLGLESQRLHLLHMGSGDVKIAWDI